MSGVSQSKAGTGNGFMVRHADLDGRKSLVDLAKMPTLIFSKYSKRDKALFTVLPAKGTNTCISAGFMCGIYASLTPDASASNCSSHLDASLAWETTLASLKRRGPDAQHLHTVIP